MSFLRLCAVLFVLSWQAFNVQAQLSKATQIIIDRGLLVEGMVTKDDVFHLDTYSNANYSVLNWFHESNTSLNGPVPGFPWGRWVGNDTQMPPQGGEAAYTNQLVNLSLSDEPNLYDDAIFNNMANWFNNFAPAFPNTILYINNWGGQIEDWRLSAFISQAHPDMISFDTYPFKCAYDSNAVDHIGATIGTPNQYYPWYSELRRYRAWGSTFNIPFGYYRQTFHAVEEYSPFSVYRDPSASELRLNTFAGLAFNAKAMFDFTYNTGASSLFTRPGGDSYPTPLYYEMQDINKRARNLGKALVRLKPIPEMHNMNDVNPPPGPASSDPNFLDGYCTSIMFMKGKYVSGGVTNLTLGPNSFRDDPEAPNASYTWWEYQKNDPYLNGWSITNKSALVNNGLPGEVIVSWFTPLDESFDGPNYTNEVYMMVVNGLTETNATPAQCAQEITFNFLNTFSSIEVLNPLTGIAEAQVLPIVNTRRQLVMTLNGGDAVLFKFSDGAPFVGVPPVITTQPVSQTKTAGNSVTFTVAANGLSITNYQWQFNGVAITDATASSYTRSNLQPSDSGNFTVVLTNTSGSVTSAVANLNVQFAPQILANPQGQTVTAGTDAPFSVSATANPTSSYRWQFNGATIAGATASTFTRSHAQTSDSGNYSVVASNALGSATSSDAVLTVNGPPYISGQPQEAGALVGGTATFNVTAIGPSLNYRWKKDGNNIFDDGRISGTGTQSLTIGTVQASDFGSYTVVVTNSYGSATSSAAALVNPTTPVIQTQPQSKTNVGGATITFNVVATGGGLGYQWRRSNTNISNGGNISGANSDTLTLSTVSKNDATNYTVVVSNVVNTVTSSVAALTLTFPMPWRDTFNYPVGDNLGVKTTPSGLNWADVGTAVAGSYITIGAGNLSIANLAPSFGNSIQFGGSGKSARLTFPASITTGTTYFSFSLKVMDLTGASAAGGFIAGFNNSANTQTGTPTVVGTRVYLRTTTGGFNLGVGKSTDTNTFWVWDPTVFTTNQTIFVVGSYTFNTGNTTDDVSSLWLNPSATTYGAATAPPASGSTSGGADIGSSQLLSFVLFQRSSTVEPALMIADDLRFGNSWASVTPGISPVRINSAQVLPNGQVQVSGNGDPASYILQSSLDLSVWTDVTNVLSTNGTFQILDSGNGNKEFYRVKIAP